MNNRNSRNDFSPYENNSRQSLNDNSNRENTLHGRFNDSNKVSGGVGNLDIEGEISLFVSRLGFGRFPDEVRLAIEKDISVLCLQYLLKYILQSGNDVNPNNVGIKNIKGNDFSNSEKNMMASSVDFEDNDNNKQKGIEASFQEPFNSMKREPHINILEPESYDELQAGRRSRNTNNISGDSLKQIRNESSMTDNYGRFDNQNIKREAGFPDNDDQLVDDSFINNYGGSNRQSRNKNEFGNPDNMNMNYMNEQYNSNNNSGGMKYSNSHELDDNSIIIDDNMIMDFGNNSGSIGRESKRRGFDDGINENNWGMGGNFGSFNNNGRLDDEMVSEDGRGNNKWNDSSMYNNMMNAPMDIDSIDRQSNAVRDLIDGDDEDDYLNTGMKQKRSSNKNNSRNFDAFIDDDMFGSFKRGGNEWELFYNSLEDYQKKALKIILRGVDVNMQLMYIAKQLSSSPEKIVESINNKSREKLFIKIIGVDGPSPYIYNEYVGIFKNIIQSDF